MSHTTILAIWPGKKYESVCRLSNSYGSGPLVWAALAKEFLGITVSYLYPNLGYMERLDEIFALWDRSDIPIYLRAVLMLTADRAYVTRENFGRAERDIKAFLDHYPDLGCYEHDGIKIHGQIAYHWPAIARYFGQNPDYPALALYCTSVAPNPFADTWEEVEHPNGECDEIQIPFDWSTAYDLYAELDSLTK